MQARLANLVLASQGVAPYTLLAGASDAPTSALPANTLVTPLEDGRPRFIRATFSEWRKVATVARQTEGRRRQLGNSWCGGSRSGATLNRLRGSEQRAAAAAESAADRCAGIR